MDGVLGWSHANAATSIEAHQPDSLSQHGPVLGEQATAGKAATTTSDRQHEDRQDLLGHRSGRITTHYSAAELSRLFEAANSVCDPDRKRSELVVLRGALQGASRKPPAKAALELTRLS